MFFVFGPSGQMYSGGPDSLGQVAPVRRSQRSQALRARPLAVEAHKETPAPEPAQRQPLNVLEAVSAYVQTERGPDKPRQPLRHVQDVMSRGAVSVTPETHVDDAWRTLAERPVGQAPVVNAQGQVVGLLLRSDIAPPELLPAPGAARQAAEQEAGRPVSEVMVSPVPTVTPDTDLRYVASVLIESDLPGLPVTDERGQLAGFISRTDILRAVAADPPLDLWS